MLLLLSSFWCSQALLPQTLSPCPGRGWGDPGGRALTVPLTFHFSLAGPVGQVIQPVLRQTFPGSELQRPSVQLVGLIFLFLIEKMFPVPLSLLWEGFGNHFQMRNDFKGEEQPKLWAILPPAPPGMGQQWGGGQAGLGGGSS